MFGQLLPFEGPDVASRQRQLLVFHYDSTSAQMLSATEVPVPVGDYADSMAVVPALKAVYLSSPLDGGFVDFFGHVFLVHYDRDGSLSQPIDATLENNPLSFLGVGIGVYGEKTGLLYGGSSLSGHEPTPFPVFAPVTRDGLVSSFRRFTVGNSGPPPVFIPCSSGSSGQVLAYTRDGTFQIGYDPNQNVLTVASITSDGVTNFASRTESFGGGCTGPIVVLRAAALDEAHHALYAVLQTLDPFTDAPVSAVLARFSFNLMTGAISSEPTQQISIAATTNRIYIPRYGSRVFIYDLFDHVSTNVTTYTLTDDGAQNPQQVGLAFSPDFLFGDAR